MSAEAVLTVRGEAVLRIAPEVAQIAVTAEVRDPDRRAAVAALAALREELDALVRGYEDAIEELEQGPVTVRPEFRNNDPREPVTGYVAGTSSTVTVADFTVLGELVAELARRDRVTVHGPTWQLRPGSGAHREARIAAARDASARAVDYAEAYGGRVIRLLELSDNGNLRGGAPGIRHAAMSERAPMAAAMSGGAAPAAVFDFDPVEQYVYAAVDARFAITVPTAAH